MDSQDWIDDFLATEPPRSKSLVVTIFGDSIVPHGGMVWLGSLIELLAPFGVNDRLLRTSVFRLAQEGWLGAQRDGRRSSYAITAPAMQRFAHAYRRIYAPLNHRWDGSWTLVINGDGALNAAQRSALRKELLWEGYGAIAPGIMGHPAAEAVVLDELLQRLDIAGKVFVVQGKALRQVCGRPLTDLLASGWDLSEVANAYRHFIRRFAPLAAMLGQPGCEFTPEQAFVMRTLVIHAYRRVQLHDPQLPLELLPAPWPGSQAYELARAIYLAVQGAAEQHIDAALQKEDAAAPAAAAAYFERFGGLN
ncbi:phenylacetic acid degradation operon negative regulatory protein PaaX [Duganella qianjiadongensis]|uniref:Phenylacetic acid degradation operon negative regulatory protein PaaX n=1 Tax=Duganella qianjiadongensis TaxID=2692176 RepID=A0ABW9VNS3_9BURK|nr:phenylacetic acid degradation operon negative regulatory protein PaaX [Duganella qianjiadongensis]MYM40270.1 phenylacetic acid degradation operon negative regulatory protein PaaX [Duganella qianjiadongensis]